MLKADGWRGERPVFERLFLMGLLFLFVGAFASLGGPAHAQTQTLTLDEFARPETVFDSGAGFGRNSATIPLSGTGAPGGTVQARTVLFEGAGASTATAQSTDWTTIAQVQADGRWAGTLTGLTRSFDWSVAQVRMQDAPTRILTGGSKFAAGHVVALWGQSEWHRAVLPDFANLKLAEDVTDPEALRVAYSAGRKDSYGDPGNFRFAKIDAAHPVTSHLTALSNALAALRPGEKFFVVFHTKSGSSKAALVDDANPNRTWADDVALHGFAFPQGDGPGLGVESWYNADSHDHLGQYGRLTTQVLVGLNPDGTRTTQKFQAVDHSLFPELYAPERTAWSIAGPHRFDAKGYDEKIPSVREGVNDLFSAKDTLGLHLLRGLEPLSYRNGTKAGKDLSHPSTGDLAPDGMHRFMRLTAAAMVQSLGLTTWSVPQFDRARPADDLSYVEVWSEAGPITTTRAARNEAMPAGAAQVHGFRLNGAPLRRAELKGGKVRLYPNDTSRFLPGDTLEFASDGVGITDRPADLTQREVWKDYPLVDVGLSFLEGIPLRAQTGQDVLGVLPRKTAKPTTFSGPDLLPRLSQNAVERGCAEGGLPGDAGRALGDDGAVRLPAGATCGPISLAFAIEPAWRGRPLALHFVMDGAGELPHGTLAVNVVARGGGQSVLLKDTVAVARDQPVTLALPPLPADRRKLVLVLRRSRLATGVLELRDLALHPRN